MTSAALAKSFPILSFETYLEIEANAPNKHEFYQGVIFARPGATNRHLIIASNAQFQLSRLLARRKCYVLAEARVVTPNDAASFYADVSVHCDQVLPPSALQAQSPVLVVEVLSPSTRKLDLNAKRKEYFRILSLRHYLLLDSETQEAHLYSREADSTWPKEAERFTNPKALIPLNTVKTNLKLADLYRQTDFAQ